MQQLALSRHVSIICRRERKERKKNRKGKFEENKEKRKEEKKNIWAGVSDEG